MKNKIVVGLAIVVACSIPLFAGETVPLRSVLPLGLASAAPPRPNGDFVISVEHGGAWREVGRLGGDRFLREQRLDLAPWLPGNAKARVRIRQEGGGASHLDAVLLGGGAPLGAGSGMLDKLRRRDNDLASASGREIELTFAARGDAILSLTGRIESQVIASEPMQFPMENTFRAPSVSSSFYSYRLDSAAPPRHKFASRAWRTEIGRRQPLFEVLAPTGSGHPSGYTYGWVSNDRRNLYVTIDFTSDNTYDGDKDYAKVIVRGNGRVREFKVSVPEKRWGRAHFTYTDKAAYQHKVYDFIIPLAELPGGDLDLCFAAYGTASPFFPMNVNLAYDGTYHRYLAVYGMSSEMGSDILGQFIGVDGNDIGAPFVIAGVAGVSEIRPVVAFDRINGRYMVAWDEYASGYFLLGQVLDDAGAPLGASFQIAMSAYSITSKAIAFDDVNQRYLIAWCLNDYYMILQIRGQLRDRDGGLVNPGEPLIDLAPDGARPNSVDVAFDSQSGQYLVVWDNRSLSPGLAAVDPLPPGSQIIGQMIDGAGLPSGGAFAITTDADLHQQPTVANDGNNHRFLVAWINASGFTSAPATGPGGRYRNLGVSDLAANPGTTIVGQLLSNLGAPLGPPRDISTGPDYRLYPRLAFDSSHGRYLAAFQRFVLPATVAARRTESAQATPFDGDVMGQYLDAGGAPIETAANENFLVGTPSFIFFPLAVAAESACGSFLATWSTISDSDVNRAVAGTSQCPGLPTVETLPVSAITRSTAAGGGRVNRDGGAAVTARGVCWNTAGSPTLANAHSRDGAGLGLFGSALSGLLSDTTYQVRAYASNSMGTAYGNEVSFTTYRWLVTFLADAGGLLSGQTSQWVHADGSCTPVAAQPGTGQFFRLWQGSDGSSSLANPLTVAHVNSNLTFTARFGALSLGITRRVEHAWIVRAEYADVEISVEGLADSGAAKFLLLRKETGGDWEVLKEIQPGEFTNGRYSFVSLPLAEGKAYSFRVEARSASGALLGASAEVTI